VIAIRNSPGINNVLLLNTFNAYSDDRLAAQLEAPIITDPILGVIPLLLVGPNILDSIVFEYNIIALYPLISWNIISNITAMVALK
jgi:hypothetical protein